MGYLPLFALRASRGTTLRPIVIVQLLNIGCINAVAAPRVARRAKRGGGGGNRTRVRRTSASKDYVRIQSVKFRERNVRIGRSAHPLAP